MWQYYMYLQYMVVSALTQEMSQQNPRATGAGIF